MISVEKPGSPTEVLEHHGTKGMKWGVRQEFRARNPTSGQKADAIRLARAKSNVKLQKATKIKGGSSAQVKAARLTFLRDPDRATALRMTRGEKVAAAIVAGVIPPAAPFIGIGVTGQYAVRRHIEKKQARGGYN